MRKLFWRLKSRGFQPVSIFISREHGEIDRVFASLLKDGKGYNYDGKEFVENSGINGKAFEFDDVNIGEIDAHSPESRHMVLISSESIRILEPRDITTVKVVELTLDGKLVAEYEQKL